MNGVAHGGLFRRVAATFACVAAILTVAIAANLIGIRIVGDVNGWTRWLHAHGLQFAVWRGLLYLLTAVGWWWMRGRVLSRESNADARTRLLRTEIATILVIATLEAITFLQKQ